MDKNRIFLVVNILLMLVTLRKAFELLRVQIAMDGLLMLFVSLLATISVYEYARAVYWPDRVKDKKTK